MDGRWMADGKADLGRCHGVSDLSAQAQQTTGEVWTSQKPITLNLVWYARPQEACA